MTAIKLTPGRVQQIPWKQVLPDPDQPRQAFDKTSLRALADNIKQRGIQQPILVRLGTKGEIIIKDGERRWRAAELAKLRTVPVLLVADAKDAAQRGIDQVAVNSLREELKPIELARFLVKLREEQKLSPNQIAARLEKDGMKAMSRSHVSNLMRLVDLPTWAAEMLNEGTIEATAARGILAVNDFAPAKQALKNLLSDRIEWGGRATVKDVDESVQRAYTATAIDLKANYAYEESARAKLPHFDWKKVCAGCQHLKEYGGGAFCLNAEEFKRKNDEAKAAGLGIGGIKPRAERVKELTPKQQKAAETQKVEKRKESLANQQRDYLHAWLIERLVEKIATDEMVQYGLVIFAACWRPGIPSYDLERFNVGYRNKTLAAAAALGFDNLTAILERHLRPAGVLTNEKIKADLSREIVRQLPWPETQMLAHYVLGMDLSPIWKIDGEFVQLLRKAELAAIATLHCELPEGSKSWSSLKAPALHEALLARADAIPVPPDLQRLYEDLTQRTIDGSEQWEDDDDDSDVDADAGQDQDD